MTNFACRHVLVTGAASGVGRGIALDLARQGHRLLLTDLNESGLKETVRLIDEQPKQASAAHATPRVYPLDISSPEALDSFASELSTQDIDVIINNAGLQHVAPVDEFALKQWDLLMDVMLRAPFVLMRSLLPGMRARQFGRIINIGSIHSLVASPFKSAYVAAKHGLLGLSKVAALETGDAEITVNTICPSYVRTPIVERQIQAQAQRHGISEEDVINKIMLEPMPKRRFIGIDEIAGTVAFLMSESARNITGQTIVIDGGWTAR